MGKRNFQAWKSQLANELRAIGKASSCNCGPTPKTIGFSELRGDNVLITPRRVRQPPLKRSKSTAAPRPVTRHEPFRRRNFRAWKRQLLDGPKILPDDVVPSGLPFLGTLMVLPFLYVIVRMSLYCRHYKRGARRNDPRELTDIL